MRRWFVAVLSLFLLTAWVLPCAAERQTRHETYSFAVGSDEEKEYLLKKGTLNSSNIRYADAVDEIIYRFSLRKTDYIQTIEFCGALYQQLLLCVSTDGLIYTEVYRWQGEVAGNGSGGLGNQLRRFDLTPYIDLDGASEIYVKIADSYTTGGWGGAIHPSENVTLDITHIIPTDAEKNAVEMKENAHRVPLFGCNEGAQGTFELDRTHVFGGTASLRHSMKCGTPSLTVKLSPNVCAEGMDTLCFSWYLSDAALLSQLGEGSLTLTDAANGTLRFSMGQVVAALDAPTSGWNVVSLPLNEGRSTGGFDLASIASVAWTWENVTGKAEGFICLDTVCLTDDQASARAEALVNVAPLMKVCERIEELFSTPLGEQNFKEIARLSLVLREDVEALGEQDYQLAFEVGVLETLQKSESAVEDYEKALKSGSVTAAPDEPSEDRESDRESIAPPTKAEETVTPSEQESEKEPEQNAAPVTVGQEKKTPWLWIGAAVLAVLVAFVGTLVARKKKTKKS